MLFIFFMFASLTFGSKFQDRCHLCGKKSASLTEGCKKCKAQACMNCIRDMKLGKAEKDGNGQIKIIQGKNGQEIVRGPKTECHCKNWENFENKEKIKNDTSAQLMADGLNKDSKFGAGSLVRLKGLEGKKEYNDQTGIVIEYLGKIEGHHTYRVEMLLENGTPYDLKVKQKNLESAFAPQEKKLSNILNEKDHTISNENKKSTQKADFAFPVIKFDFKNPLLSSQPQEEKHPNILNEKDHTNSNENKKSIQKPFNIEKRNAITFYGNHIADFIGVISVAGFLSTQMDPLIAYIITVFVFFMKKYFSL